MTKHPHHAIVTGLIAALNERAAPDIVATLFTPDAVIDDTSTGHRFEGHRGIWDYVERYFVGYHTVTQLLAIDTLADGRTRARVEFTGDFGCEIGLLDLIADEEQRITRIDADLE